MSRTLKHPRIQIQFQSELHHTDALIREGRIEEASLALRSLQSHPPRSATLRAQLAAQLQRVGRPGDALRLLRLSTQRIWEPHERDLELVIEYASSLCQLRALTSALRVLSQKGVLVHPKTQFILGVTYMSSWDYEQALNRFKDFHRLAPSPRWDYEKLVADVNILACHINLAQWQNAIQALDALSASLQKTPYNRLLKNVFELSIQIKVLSGQSIPASIVSRFKSVHFAQESRVIDDVFIKKWNLIKALKQGEPNARDHVLDFIEWGRRENNPELVRDLEFFLAKHDGDQNRLTKVFFGTPYKAYLKRFHSDQLHHQCFTLSLGEAAADATSFNLDEFIMRENLSVPALALAASLKDFYRTPGLVEVFCDVYPDEHFNPYSSPGKIHQAIFRLNALMRKLKVPFQISTSGWNYDVRTTHPVRIFMQRPARDYVEGQPDQLRFEYASPRLGPSFKAIDVHHVFQCSLRTAQNHIQGWETLRLITRQGTTRGATYTQARPNTSE